METLKTQKFKLKPHVRKNPKVGRNDMCPCNSGKKFKNCCEKTFREQMQEYVIKRRQTTGERQQNIKPTPSPSMEGSQEKG